MKKLIPIILALALLAIGTISIHAQTTVTATSGFVQTVGQVGGTITVVDIVLDQGGTAALTCPVTYYGAGPYAKNWYCGQGPLSIDGHVVATITPSPYTPTMTYTCSGGGRGKPVRCSYHFYADTADGGSVSWSSKFSSVTSFSATYSPLPTGQSPIAPTPTCIPETGKKTCPPEQQ